MFKILLLTLFSTPIFSFPFPRTSQPGTVNRYNATDPTTGKLTCYESSIGGNYGSSYATQVNCTDFTSCPSFSGMDFSGIRSCPDPDFPTDPSIVQDYRANSTYYQIPTSSSPAYCQSCRYEFQAWWKISTASIYKAQGGPGQGNVGSPVQMCDWNALSSQPQWQWNNCGYKECGSLIGNNVLFNVNYSTAPFNHSYYQTNPPQPANYSCIRPCTPGDKGNYILARYIPPWSQSFTYCNQVQCAGPNNTACTWFSDAKCSVAAPGEVSPVVNPQDVPSDYGVLCPTYVSQGPAWCDVAFNAIYQGNSGPSTCFADTSIPTASSTLVPASTWFPATSPTQPPSTTIPTSLITTGVTQITSTITTTSILPTTSKTSFGMKLSIGIISFIIFI